MAAERIFLLGALLALAATEVEAARTLGSLKFEPCALSPGVAALTVDAQCATLNVPEDRATPDGRSIELAIAWIPNDTGTVEPDPVFMLAGGPGQAASEGYPLLHQAFAETRRKRHLILVDQRGTGKSNALICRDDEGKSAFGDEGIEDATAFRTFAEKCLATLAADPRHYTTSEAIQDLDAVRAAIGAERIDLVGISYGTRVAQAYLRRYPDHVRTVVLDGVVPPALILGSEHAKNLEASLDLQFEHCARVPACRERYGSPRAKLDALLAATRAAPQTVRYRDPVTHAQREDVFSASILASVVRLFAYSPSTAAMLPLTLHEAMQGRPEALMAQARMLQSLVGEQIMHGMQLSVICTEDVPFMQVDPADARTTLGTMLLELTRAQCEVWPKGTLPGDFHAPVASDKPVLLLSGEFDPVTPPRYGEQVLKALPNGRHLVLRGQGHNVLPQGCAPKLMATFLESSDAKALDAKCLDELTYVPPFAGFYGWEP